MDARRKLRLLRDLLDSLGVEVRSSPAGDSAPRRAGALIRLKDREILFLDSHASTEEQIRLIGAALRGREELQDRFLPPDLRETIEGDPG